MLHLTADTHTPTPDSAVTQTTSETTTDDGTTTSDVIGRINDVTVAAIQGTHATGFNADMMTDTYAMLTVTVTEMTMGVGVGTETTATDTGLVLVPELGMGIAIAPVASPTLEVGRE